MGQNVRTPFKYAKTKKLFTNPFENEHPVIINMKISGQKVRKTLEAGESFEIEGGTYFSIENESDKKLRIDIVTFKEVYE